MEFRSENSLMGAQRRQGMGSPGGSSAQWATNKHSGNWPRRSDPDYLTESKRYRLCRLDHAWDAAGRVVCTHGSGDAFSFAGALEEEWGCLLGYLTGMVARAAPRTFVTVEEHMDFYNRTMSNQVRNTGESLGPGLRAAAFPEHEALEAAFARPKWNADGYSFLVCESHQAGPAKIEIPGAGDQFLVEHGGKFDGYFAALRPCTGFDRRYLAERFRRLAEIAAGLKGLSTGMGDVEASFVKYPGLEIYPPLTLM